MENNNNNNSCNLESGRGKKNQTRLFLLQQYIYFCAEADFSEAIKQYTQYLNKKFNVNANEMRYPEKTTIFFSYAWPDDRYEYDDKWVQEFLRTLCEHLGHESLNIKPLLDDENSKASSDMVRYMEDGIKKSDFVVLIGTETLKNKLDADEMSDYGKNVRLEVKKILKRFDDECKTGDNEAPPLSTWITSIIPMLISGTFESAFSKKEGYCLPGKISIKDCSTNNTDYFGFFATLIFYIYSIFYEKHHRAKRHRAEPPIKEAGAIKEWHIIIEKFKSLKKAKEQIQSTGKKSFCDNYLLMEETFGIREILSKSTKKKIIISSIIHWRKSDVLSSYISNYKGDYSIIVRIKADNFLKGLLLMALRYDVFFQEGFEFFGRIIRDLGLTRELLRAIVLWLARTAEESGGKEWLVCIDQVTGAEELKLIKKLDLATNLNNGANGHMCIATNNEIPPNKIKKNFEYFSITPRGATYKQSQLILSSLNIPKILNEDKRQMDDILEETRNKSMALLWSKEEACKVKLQTYIANAPSQSPKQNSQLSEFLIRSPDAVYCDLTPNLKKNDIAHFAISFSYLIRQRKKLQGLIFAVSQYNFFNNYKAFILRPLLKLSKFVPENKNELTNNICFVVINDTREDLPIENVREQLDRLLENRDKIEKEAGPWGISLIDSFKQKVIVANILDNGKSREEINRTLAHFSLESRHLHFNQLNRPQNKLFEEIMEIVQLAPKLYRQRKKLKANIDKKEIELKNLKYKSFFLDKPEEQMEAELKKLCGLKEKNENGIWEHKKKIEQIEGLKAETPTKPITIRHTANPASVVKFQLWAPWKKENRRFISLGNIIINTKAEEATPAKGLNIIGYNGTALTYANETGLELNSKGQPVKGPEAPTIEQAKLKDNNKQEINDLCQNILIYKIDRKKHKNNENEYRNIIALVACPGTASNALQSSCLISRVGHGAGEGASIEFKNVKDSSIITYTYPIGYPIEREVIIFTQKRYLEKNTRAIRENSNKIKRLEQTLLKLEQASTFLKNKNLPIGAQTRTASGLTNNTPILQLERRIEHTEGEIKHDKNLLTKIEDQLSLLNKTYGKTKKEKGKEIYEVAKFLGLQYKNTASPKKSTRVPIKKTITRQQQELLKLEKDKRDRKYIYKEILFKCKQKGIVVGLPGLEDKSEETTELKISMLRKAVKTFLEETQDIYISDENTKMGPFWEAYLSEFCIALKIDSFPNETLIRALAKLLNLTIEIRSETKKWLCTINNDDVKFRPIITIELSDQRFKTQQQTNVDTSKEFSLSNSNSSEVSTNQWNYYQLNNVWVQTHELETCLKDIDENYTADYINLRLQIMVEKKSVKTKSALDNNNNNNQNGPVISSAFIKVYPATSTEGLASDHKMLFEQTQRYAFVPLNVAYGEQSQQKNHWVALMIDKQKQQLYYLDPAQKTQPPQAVLALQTAFDFNNNPFILCPINFQIKEQQEGRVRHCGAYVVEIFRCLYNAIADNKDVSNELESILSSIPCGEAESIQTIRTEHAREVKKWTETRALMNPNVSGNQSSFFYAPHINESKMNEEAINKEQETIQKNYQNFVSKQDEPLKSDDFDETSFQSQSFSDEEIEEMSEEENSSEHSYASNTR